MMSNYMYRILKEVIKIPTDNLVKEIRERLMMSKSELARKAGISVLTVDRVEKGQSCRLGTKRKIVDALGYNPWVNSKTAAPPRSGMHDRILHEWSPKPDHEQRQP
jgi:predicted transcriptional regulator